MNAVVSQLVAALVLNACDAVGKLAKRQFVKYYGDKNDDDEYEVTPGSLLEAYLQDNIRTLLGNAWFGSEAGTALFMALGTFGIGRGADWYDISAPEFDTINNIVDDTKRALEMFKNGKTNPWNVTKKIANIFFDLAVFAGVPANNVKNLIYGIYGDITDIGNLENLFDNLDGWAENDKRPGKQVMDSAGKKHDTEADMTFEQYIEYDKYYREKLKDMQSGRIKKQNGKKYDFSDKQSRAQAKSRARSMANKKFKAWFKKVEKED